MKIFSRELDNPGINDVIGSIDIFHAMLVREFGSDFSGGGWEERRWGARGECSEEKSRWAIVGRGEKGVGVKVYGEGKSWRCAYFMRLLYTHHQFSVSPLTFHGHYSPAEAFGAGAAWRTRNRCSQLFFYLPSSTFSSFISSILPPPPPVFLSFNGLTATTGFEWGASQLFIGIRVFPFSGSTRYDPLTGFVRRADIYEKSWRNKDITSGCASVAVKCRDNVIYPLLYCVNCAHFPDSQLTKHKECKLKLLTT